MSSCCSCYPTYPGKVHSVPIVTDPLPPFWYPVNKGKNKALSWAVILTFRCVLVVTKTDLSCCFWNLWATWGILWKLDSQLLIKGRRELSCGWDSPDIIYSKPVSAAWNFKIQTKRMSTKNTLRKLMIDVTLVWRRPVEMADTAPWSDTDDQWFTGEAKWLHICDSYIYDDCENIWKDKSICQHRRK